MDNILSSKEAEESVIAAILVNRENQKYIDKIYTEDFYYTKNLRIFELMKELKQKVIDSNELVKTLYETPKNPTFEVFTISGNATIADFSGEPPKTFQL